MLLCLSVSGSRYRCSRDAELQAESSLAATPFSWQEVKCTWALTVAPETALGAGSQTPFSPNEIDFTPPVSCFSMACVWRRCRKPAQLVASAPVRRRGRVAPRFVVCPSLSRRFSLLFVGGRLIDTVIVSVSSVSATLEWCM